MILKPGAWAVMCALAAAAAIGLPTARAADLTGPWPPAPLLAYGYGPAYGYAGFDPLLDPRCRVVPMPEASLYGETARFRPTAVCQSRGLYADSVLFP